MLISSVLKATTYINKNIATSLCYRTVCAWHSNRQIYSTLNDTTSSLISAWSQILRFLAIYSAVIGIITSAPQATDILRFCGLTLAQKTVKSLDKGKKRFGRSHDEFMAGKVGKSSSCLKSCRFEHKVHVEPAIRPEAGGTQSPMGIHMA